ncbi:MAG: hypothetical protein JKY53_15150 [Flavobacteriales bacterium]|nr:hypothetical protein [Flavobacteriales bacterium]
MTEKFIELKQDKDFGDIITVYFNFLKHNFKSFINIFINYNGYLILALLGISYMLVTGFMGLASTIGLNEAGGAETDYSYLVIGLILFLIVMILVAALNYSLATSYMIHYENEKTSNPNKTAIWQLVSKNLGNIVVFIVLIFLIYIGLAILNIVLAFIPVFGFIVSYIIGFAASAWIGISFMVMLNEKIGVTESLSEGWNLVIKNFWLCVGVNFILGLLLLLLIMVITFIPGFLVGIYSFLAVDSGVELSNSITSKIIFTLATAFFLILLALYQSISHFINGVLYYSLHERMYNDFTREKIEQIGRDD